MDGVKRWIGEGKAASSIRGDWAGGCEARAGGWERRGVERAVFVGPLQNVTSHALLGEPGPGNHKTAPLTSTPNFENLVGRTENRTKTPSIPQKFGVRIRTHGLEATGHRYPLAPDSGKAIGTPNCISAFEEISSMPVNHNR